MLQTVECTLPELLKRLNEGRIPMDAKVHVTFDDNIAASTQDKKDPIQSLLEQWEKEDMQLTAEQQVENARVYAEIEQNGIPRVRI